VDDVMTEHDIMVKQNEVVIALLARSTFGVKFIQDVVTKGKKDPQGYIRAYNGLDGSIGVTEAAKLAGVSQPTMTEILKSWESQGIIYNTGNSNRPAYRRLLPLPPRPARSPEKGGQA